MMDNAALTALVDRWRPEMHTFDLPAGEMMMTLQDVAMILGLPIDGRAVTGTIDPVGWRDSVAILFGLRPPEPEAGEKDKKPTGVHSSWLRNNFGLSRPEDADPTIVERYARAWLWHMIVEFLFPDASGNSGNTVSWTLLGIIGQQWELIGTYSWGSATLAWLYRQLCDACRRSGDNANLGGCAFLLQVWMWERLPVGRPDRQAPGNWPYDDEGSHPTVAYLWKNALNVVGNRVRRYAFYNNELDCLAAAHVTWLPYTRLEVTNMQLSPLCYRDQELWRSVLPLIYFYVVEYHLPNRVMRQFGILQTCPPEHILTSVELHKMDPRRQRGKKNWEETHVDYVNAWNQQQSHLVQGGAQHRDAPYRRYLDWLKENTRLKLKVAFDATHVEDLPSDPEDRYDEYDEVTQLGRQPERGPFEDYIGQQLGRFANEAGQALSVPVGSPEEASILSGFLQRFRQGCRRLAMKMNCKASTDQVIAGCTSSSGQCTPSTRSRTSRRPLSRSTSTSRGGRGGRGIASYTAGSSGAHAPSTSRGKEPVASEESEEDDGNDSEEDDPTYGDDVLGLSQLPNATEPTHSTPPARGRGKD